MNQFLILPQAKIRVKEKFAIKLGVILMSFSVDSINIDYC